MDASFGEPRQSASRGGEAKAGGASLATSSGWTPLPAPAFARIASVGIVAAVVKGKDTLLLKAYGKADVEGDVPMTVDTVFPIGSVTKQFTAAAILQLRDQGKLSLDDDITKWLPDFETRGNKVTLRHLLGHTSGIVDLGEMPELRAMQLMRNPTVTRDAVYKIISRYPFQFPTGTHADLQQLRLLASRSHHREGERDDLRGVRREEDLRAAGHDALDVLQQLEEGPAPRLRVRHAERHHPPRAGRSCTRGPTPPARSARPRGT